MMDRETWVAHRLSGILYESWTPEQVNAIAIIACEAIDEYHRERWMRAAETLKTRRDHNIDQAWAYRDGVEDTLALWETEWDEQ